jgi:hypothetical protein
VHNQQVHLPGRQALEVAMHCSAYASTSATWHTWVRSTAAGAGHHDACSLVSLHAIWAGSVQWFAYKCSRYVTS